MFKYKWVVGSSVVIVVIYIVFICFILCIFEIFYIIVVGRIISEIKGVGNIIVVEIGWIRLVRNIVVFFVI